MNKTLLYVLAFMFEVIVVWALMFSCFPQQHVPITAATPQLIYATANANGAAVYVTQDGTSGTLYYNERGTYVNEFPLAFACSDPAVIIVAGNWAHVFSCGGGYEAVQLPQSFGVAKEYLPLNLKNAP